MFSSEDNACLVTYGGMSKDPVTIPTSLFIFRNISCKGFWMTRWNNHSNLKERTMMLENLLELIRSGKFVEPLHENIENIQDAINIIGKSMTGFRGKKPIISFKKALL